MAMFHSYVELPEGTSVKLRVLRLGNSELSAGGTGPQLEDETATPGKYLRSPRQKQLAAVIRQNHVGQMRRTHRYL